MTVTYRIPIIGQEGPTVKDVIPSLEIMLAKRLLIAEGGPVKFTYHGDSSKNQTLREFLEDKRIQPDAPFEEIRNAVLGESGCVPAAYFELTWLAYNKDIKKMMDKPMFTLSIPTFYGSEKEDKFNLDTLFKNVPPYLVEWVTAQNQEEVTLMTDPFKELGKSWTQSMTDGIDTTISVPSEFPGKDVSLLTDVIKSKLKSFGDALGQKVTLQDIPDLIKRQLSKVNKVFHKIPAENIQVFPDNSAFNLPITGQKSVALDSLYVKKHTYNDGSGDKTVPFFYFHGLPEVGIAGFESLEEYQEKAGGDGDIKITDADIVVKPEAIDLEKLQESLKEKFQNALHEDKALLLSPLGSGVASAGNPLLMKKANLKAALKAVPKGKIIVLNEFSKEYTEGVQKRPIKFFKNEAGGIVVVAQCGPDNNARMVFSDIQNNNVEHSLDLPWASEYQLQRTQATQEDLAFLKGIKNLSNILPGDPNAPIYNYANAIIRTEGKGRTVIKDKEGKFGVGVPADANISPNHFQQLESEFKKLFESLDRDSVTKKAQDYIGQKGVQTLPMPLLPSHSAEGSGLADDKPTPLRGPIPEGQCARIGSDLIDPETGTVKVGERLPDQQGHITASFFRDLPQAQPRRATGQNKLTVQLQKEAEQRSQDAAPSHARSA